MDSPNDSDHYVYKCSSLAIPSADTCYSSNWQLNQSLINKPLTHEPWPRMWSPRDTYFRSQFQRSFNGHSYYCCLSVDNKTGCRNCDTSSLTEKQLKLFNKLKTKYPKLSDDILIESMRKTREQLVNSGQSKGFNGLKIVEIINKISEYIDEEVLNEEEIDNKNDGQSHPSKCGICNNGFQTMSERLTLSCNHLFHFNCLEVWAQDKTHNSCPNCKDRRLTVRQ